MSGGEAHSINGMSHGRLVETLRSGSCLTRERMRIWAFGMLAASALGFIYLVATSDGLNDYQGRPLGTDFSNVYAAGSYVLDGEAAAPFDWPSQYAREQAIFGDKHAVLRLALSAVLPVRRGAARADALRAVAGGLAGRDACALSRHDPHHPADRRGRCRQPAQCSDPRFALAAARARVPGGVRQHRPRPQRLPHRGADRRARWSCSTRGRRWPACCSGSSPTSRSSAC